MTGLLRDWLRHIWFVGSRLVLGPLLLALLGAPMGYMVLSILSLPLFLIGALGAVTVGFDGGIGSFYTTIKPYSWMVGSFFCGGLGLKAGLKDLKSEYVLVSRLLSRSRLEITLEVQHPEAGLKAELPDVERLFNIEQIVPSVGDKIRVGQHIQFEECGDVRTGRREEWVWDCVVSEVEYDVQPFHETIDVRVLICPAEYSKDLL